MAKISPASIKYTITADFRSEGPLETPDVIGALFGQTEGLLGSDMELRELQKEGKIGRIDVVLTKENGKTTGEITIPSALDKTETTIIAATLETIDKIGPTDAKITIREIEDVRGNKRDYIMERAKQLLATVKGAGTESQEMGQELRESSRALKITSYGDEKLPAGDISGNEVIVVEGRADVVNMLKHNITNVIGMDGAKLPKEISKLGETKELTLFVDGDRGGKLIAKNVYDNAKLVYITSAPDGKEVEELTGKELQIALRKKVPAKEFLGLSSSSSASAPVQKTRSDKKLSAEDKKVLKELYSEIRGNIKNYKLKNVLVLGEDLKVLRNISPSKLDFLEVESQPWIVMASAASAVMVREAEKLGASYVAAKTFGNVGESSVELVSI